MKISIVIPSYNGWDRLPELCSKIISEIGNELEFEIIIVDDGSVNRSDTFIRGLRDAGVDVKGVFLGKNYGQQLATLAGLKVSQGDFVITVDDDLSHNPKDFAELLLKVDKGSFDVVFGISGNSRAGLLRKGGSGLRDSIFNVFFKKPGNISVSSFRILSRALVNKINSDISEYRYLSVAILKHAEKIANIQVHYKREQGNISRYNFIKLTLLAFSLIRCSHFFPERIRKSKAALEMEWDLV